MFKRTREWLPLFLAVVAIGFTAGHSYVYDYPRPGLLFQPLPPFSIFSTRDLDPRHLRFSLINSGNQDVLVVSIRLVFAKPLDTEWTDILDLPEVVQPVALKAGEMRIVNIDIPAQFTDAVMQQQLGPWIGLKSAVIIPSGKQFIAQYPMVAFHLPQMPKGFLGNAGFCLRQVSLVQNINIMPSSRDACR
ncbi:MAG: hypothetical protein HY727_19650 [Candidatus Rokubacteria bacterium]|nr:hypothetical protein [Candidatus Rokubacteria bacterium]